LMTLPKEANWVYDFKTKAGSEEQKTLNLLKKEIDWLNA
jgi:coproporphyrinogen III oxidase